MLYLSKPDTQKKYVLTQTSYTIGRDPSNDLVLEDALISGFHATIFVENGKVEMVDQGSSNGTFVNDQPISGRVELKAWDTIRLGNVMMEVVDDAARRPTAIQTAISDDAIHAARENDDPDAILRLISTGSFPAEVAVHDHLSIGRNSGSDLCLTSDMVSGDHARLTVSSGRTEITDLGSTNGTWVNGRRIEQQIVKHGDRIRFDEIEYELFLPGGKKKSSKTIVNPAIQNVENATVVRPVVQVEEVAQPEEVDAVPVKVVENQVVAVSEEAGSTTVIPQQRGAQGPPPHMDAPSLESITGNQSLAAGRKLSFHGTILQFVGWSALALICSILIIPAAWGIVPLFKWLVGESRFSDNTQADFIGKPTQIWWILALILFIGQIPMVVGSTDQTSSILISYGLPFLFLPLTAFLWLLLVRWILESIQLSCGTRLRFNASYGPFLGWAALNMVSVFTIIGWAWVSTAFYRWICSHIEGGGQTVLFHGKGHEFLWRTLLTFLGSIFIIPAPWLFLWLFRWLFDQIEVR